LHPLAGLPLGGAQRAFVGFEIGKKVLIATPRRWRGWLHAHISALLEGEAEAAGKGLLVHPEEQTAHADACADEH
jgi:hypothetical protein